MQFKKKPFIIAEIGSNFTDFKSCLNTIAYSASCGADAVKFQLYSHKEMYGYEGPKQTINKQCPHCNKIWESVGTYTRHGLIKCRHCNNIFEYSKQLGMPGELPREWIPKLAEKAAACNIEFMCTAFSLEGYSYINKYVNLHKIASSDLSNLPVLNYLSNLQKPVLLSTGGGWGSMDIFNSLIALRPAPVVVLHCVSSYPASRACLDKILWLEDKFNVPVGYSDHTLDVFDLPALAVKNGAIVLEKHFNPLGLKDTPDAPHSLSLDDFKDMVKYLRGDSLVYVPGRCQNDMKLKHLRRIVAIRPIKEGDILEYENNIGIYRTKENDEKGLSGFQIYTINGKRAVKDFNLGEGIHF